MPAPFARWAPHLALILALVALRIFAPAAPLDPWGLFSPQKISQMILAIALVQLIGIALRSWVGMRAGNLITGFLGGLISSTATTATLARQSRQSSSSQPTAELLVYYSATLAMLLEAVLLVAAGSELEEPRIFLVFLGPVLITLGKLAHTARRSTDERIPANEAKPIALLSVLKLAAFIAVILALSKAGQHLLGNTGLVALTFLISLFEIHASVISNVQLFSNGSIGPLLLGGLLAASLSASYLSKLFLVTTLGSAPLSREIRSWSIVMGITIALSFALVWATSSFSGSA